MDEILVRAGTPTVPPEIAELLKPLLAQWQAAILRVGAAHVDPASFKLPGAASAPEAILAARFGILPDALKERSGATSIALLANKNRLKALGKAVDLDFSSTQSVTALAKPVPGKLSATAVREIAGRRSLNLGMAPHIGLPFSRRNLDFNLIRVRCVDETNGFLGSEAGDDEIELGGSAVDETGDTTKVSAFKVGDFSDGDVKTYSPPKRLQQFNIGEGTEYPKSYFVTLVLNEADNGNFSETVDKIVKQIQDEVSAKLAAAIGAEVGASGGPIGAIIGAAVGYAVAKIFNLIIAAWEDDPFKPVTIEATIPSSTARLPDRSDVVAMTGPGEYLARYSWTLSGFSLTASKALKSFEAVKNTAKG